MKTKNTEDRTNQRDNTRAFSMVSLIAGLAIASMPLPAAAAKAPVPSLTLSNAKATAVRDTSVVIWWDTVVPADGRIEYGLNARYGKSTKKKGLSYFHTVKVAGLTPGTTYHYRIRAKDSGGKEAVSKDYTFTTRTAKELEKTIRAARKNHDLPKTYYVKTNGDDSADGLSPKTAWRHPSCAAQQVEAGDTIRLIDDPKNPDDGVWKDEHIVFSNSGIDVAPITITSHNGAPTLDGVDDAPKEAGIKIENGKGYIDITGKLVIKNYFNGIYASDVHHINIKDVTLTSNCAFQIHFKPNCKHICIDGVEITDNDKGKRGGAIVFQSWRAPSKYLTVRNSRFKTNRHDAINYHTNTQYGLVENNTIHDASYGAAIMIHNYSNKNIVIRNNKIIDSTRGIQLVGVENCLVQDNTITNSRARYGILLFTYEDHRSWIKNVTIRNNTIKRSAAMGIYFVVGKKAAISDVLCENNSMEKSFSLEGANISDITVRNMRDKARTFIIKKHPVSNLRVEFTDGRKFSVDGKGKYPAYTFPSGTRGTHKIKVIGK